MTPWRKGQKGGGETAALHDLATDVGETKKVTDVHPEVVSRLREPMKKFDAQMEGSKRPVGRGR